MITHSRVIWKIACASMALLFLLIAVFPNPTSVSAQSESPESGDANQSPAVVFSSDDFNACIINPVWHPIEPAGTDIRLYQPFTSNAAVQLSVEAGAKHILSDSNLDAPRLMQTAANELAFDVEVKFDSVFTKQPVTDVNQVQGLIFAETNGDTLVNYVRFDFFSRGGNIHFTVARYLNGVFHPLSTGMIHANFDTDPVSHMYMRVNRGGTTGQYWTVSYSFDGQNFTPIINGTTPQNYSIDARFTVNSVGIFAGNTGTITASIPSFTAYADYIQTLNPNGLTTEDSQVNTLTVTKDGTGTGTVTINPAMPAGGYACGTEVTLSAVPDSGSVFFSWSGGVTGTTNPVKFKMNGPSTVSATFNGEGTVTLNPVGYLPLMYGTE
ncbi:MAG TPA: hypothetical protein VHO48_07815 [Anaerolineaceae bacterium]|nr:hypothetical protein [Anaerolineaceae bacterium]